VLSFSEKVAFSVRWVCVDFGVGELLMDKDKATWYRRDIEDLIARNREAPICPFDGFSCCSICIGCGQPFCESGHSDACERMLGRGCSGTRGEGCPKGWRVDDSKVGG